METMMLHRGRLIDHLHLVVDDYPGALRFYSAVLQVLDVPIGGSGDDYFWADELFVSTLGSEAAAGVPTGRHHLAFQAASREIVDAFHAAGVAAGGARPWCARLTAVSSAILWRLPSGPCRKQH
jgi:catechol 2,3-dioxygenase-like lactoylglutathione lyase family enzyme